MSRDQFFDSDIAFLRAENNKENNKKPTEIPPRLISKYVEGRRVMPPGTPFPGLWRNKNTPYSVEIMDNMSPFSPVSITSVMKAAQIGLTAAAENVIGYWMDPMPAEILVCSATDSLLEKWANKRLEPLIDSIGMRHKICSQADLGAKNRRTGDKTFSKEYVGGALNMSSARSAGSLRSDSKRILILDELDGAPRLLTTGEGTWVDVAYARTNAWGIRAKILEFSTPTTWEASLIRERYELGDQRRYIVACPRCGKLIGPLEFKYLRPEFKKGFLHRVWYECPECNRELYNSDKTEMMSPEAGAFWEPSAIPEDPTHRSYQLSALYSPVGMLTWKKLYQIYLAAKGNPEKMRSFVNLYLGKPYRQLGTRPKVERIIQNKGGYREGKIEDGVLFLTCGVDVQRGAEDGDPKNPARLELEVVGHGALYRTWSILYKVIEGPTTEGPYKGAWAAFYDWIEKGGTTFEREGDSMSFPIRLMLIDSGDGVYYDSIFSFASRLGNTFPSKGFKYLSRRGRDRPA